MTVVSSQLSGTTADPGTRWSAVVSLSFLTFLLVGLEFMPASLLTPIAADLAISEGQAGIAIVVSAFFAVTASLFGNRVLSGIDRRRVVAFYTLLLTLSSLIVALSPNFTLFLIGRALVGVAVGGFWSLSTAIVARLAQRQDVPRAIAILQIGPASSLVLAAPLGSLVETWIGWRETFLATIPLGLIALAWQFAALPALPPRRSVQFSDMTGLLRRPHFAASMAAIGLFFVGQNTVSIYLRPFLETVTDLHGAQVSMTLLSLGLGGVVGLLMVGSVVRRNLIALLVAVPGILAVIAVLLVAFGSIAPATIGLLMVWGLCATPLMVAWNTWMTVNIPDELEAGGGIQVALIQCSIAGGACVGGILFDHVGWWGGFLVGGTLLVLSVFSALSAVRSVARA